MLYNNLMGYFLKSLVKNITMYTESKTFNELTLPILSSISNHTKKYSNYGIITLKILFYLILIMNVRKNVTNVIP